MVPESFARAKEELENHHEDLEIVLTNGSLVAKRLDSGNTVDYLEINGESGRWAWESKRELPVNKKEGEIDSLSDYHRIEILAERYLIPSDRDTMHEV